MKKYNHDHLPLDIRVGFGAIVDHVKKNANHKQEEQRAPISKVDEKSLNACPDVEDIVGYDVVDRVSADVYNIFEHARKKVRKKLNRAKAKVRILPDVVVGVAE